MGGGTSPPIGMGKTAFVNSMRDALVVMVLVAPQIQAHTVPDVWMTGQRFLDLFDPNIKPKMLYSEDGNFGGKLPPQGLGR